MGAPFQTVPKSGCRLVSDPMLAMKFPESGCSGYWEMSVFQALVAGKSRNVTGTSMPNDWPGMVVEVVLDAVVVVVGSAVVVVVGRGVVVVVGLVVVVVVALVVVVTRLVVVVTRLVVVVRRVAASAGLGA